MQQVEYIVISQGLHNDEEVIFTTLVEATLYFNKQKGAALYLRVQIL